MNSTSDIGLMLLLTIAAGIVAMFFSTKNKAKAFVAELKRQGFAEGVDPPGVLQKNYSYLSARRGKLLADRPDVLLVLGFLKGTSVATAGGNAQTFDDYLGFVFPADHGLDEARQKALIEPLGAPAPLCVAFADGSVLLLWKWGHSAAHVAMAVADMRKALASLPPVVMKARVPEIVPKEEPPPPVLPPVEEKPKPRTFVADNMWAWRKEGDPGYSYLPEEALHPDNTVISMDFHELAVLTPRIGTLKKLEVLSLLNTKVSELPEEIGQCQSLREISVRQCELVKLPDSICLLSRLEVLNLFYNHLTELPAGFGKLKALRELDLSSNGITHLDDSIGELESLEILNVACFKLAALPEAIKKLPRLKELVLHAEGPLALNLAQWQAALPKTNVRLASSIETTPWG